MTTIYKSRKTKSLVAIMVVMILMLSTFASFAENLDMNRSNEGLLKNKISNEVLDRFNLGEEKVEVLIKLKEQANVEKTANDQRMELNSLGLDNDEITLSTRVEVIEELENIAERTQYGLLKYIGKESRIGNVEEYQSYYIVNMVYMKATREVVNRVALRNDVEKVYFNEKVYLSDYTVEEEGIIELIEEIDMLENEEIEEGKFEIIQERIEEKMILNDTTNDMRTQAVSPSDIEWNIKQVNADKVWNKYGIDGTGVVIGMIDSGVTWNHPALKNKYRGYNASTGSVNHNGNWFDAYAGRTTPYDESNSPHGTHCMGTMLGQEPSGRNAIGVAPGAKFIVAKGLGPDGGSSNQLIAAGQWMLKPGGNAANAPNIINNSWGGGTGINNWFRDVVKAWRAAGIVPVFAAGNQQGPGNPQPGSISLPSSYPESFAVAATDSSNNRGSFSLLGPSPYDNNLPKPDISAPGVNIRSSVINGYAGGWNGTSMAAPNIAGVAALILEANPKLSVTQVENTIKNTATPLTDRTYTRSPNMGFGYGLVNALKAVESVSSSNPIDPPGPVDPPQGNASITGRVTNKNTGSAISGARVILENTSFATTTNNYGDYTITNIPAGTYKVIITATGYGTISGNITMTSNKVTTANGTMTPNAPVIKTGVMTGTVENYNNGYSISNAKVSINGTSNYAYTDRYGKFRLEDVEAAVQTITISANGYSTVSGNITVTEGKESNVRVRLTPSRYNRYDIELPKEGIDNNILEPTIEPPTIDPPIVVPPTVDM